MATATYTKSGTKAATPAKLPAEIFKVDVKDHGLVKQAYVAYMANGRLNRAKALKRGEVRGGGKKPWRQKGTGRARFGSSRNPIWRGGGIAFGPTGEENYSKKINSSSRRTALKQALSLSADKVVVIEDFEVKDGKTKQATALLSKIGTDKSVLLVVSEKTESLLRSTSNLSEVKLVSANYLNVFDVLNANHIVFTKKALEGLNEQYKGTK